MESQKVQFVGASCGQHGPYTFYKAFKYFRDNKFRILTLGEFFFLKILKEGPICIGELQLLWENSQEHQFLASVRLYYLPEHTPAGRENFHGEHEILAFSEKLILRLDDLVSLVYLDHVEWGFGLALLHEDSVEGDVQHDDVQTKFFADTQNSGLVLDDIQKEIDVLGEQKTTSTCVKVLSYAQYCRYRTIMKRLENMADKWLKKQIICALGGITSHTPNNRIMFCRDTFDDPDLDDFEMRMDHLAPNLKGRPRKKRSSKSDGNGESDETSSDISTPSSRVKASKRESALRNGFKFDKDRISKDEQAFLIDLHKFMKKRHTPIDRIPSLGFKQIDLWYFYTYAHKLGGYEQITRKRLWKHLYDVLGGNPGSTSAATCTRRHYEKLLLPYERYAQDETATRSTVSNKQKRKAEFLAKARAEAKERLQDAQDSDYDYEEEQNHAFKRLKKVSRNPKTVKSLLNNAEKEKSYIELKTDNGENNFTETFDLRSETGGQENGKLQQDGSVVKLEKLNGSSAMSDDPKQASDGKSLVSQSKLFRADPVQSNTLATEADLLQFDRTRLSQMPGHHPALPGGGMFYPPFIHMGGLHPLSLPVMHQMPVSMQQLIQSPHQPAKSSAAADKSAYHQNTMRSGSNSSSSSSSEQRPSVIQHGHQSKMATAHLSGSKRDTSPAPQKSHHHGSHTSATYVPGAPAPKAHSGRSSSLLKRPYNSQVPSEAHIPNPQRTHSNNRSLLFDFEAPKRPKMETQPAHSNNSSSSNPGSVVSSETEQPCDLSMKSFRRSVHKEDRFRDRNGDPVADRGSNSPAESPFSVKSLAQSSISSSRYASPGMSSRSHLLLDRVHSPDVQASVFSQASVSSPNIPPAHSNSKAGDRPLVPPPAHSNKTTDNLPSKKSSSSSTAPSLPSTVPADPSGLPHPAFPHHMVRPQFPQQPYFPSPMQLHQFFEAQIRTNAAYEEMMTHDQRRQYSAMSMPMFMPQVPLHAQAAKDKSHYAHAK
ncbi:AT-rich interactive domain-containing protein 5B-like isoform X2 [Mizuhopecten yessoensis]|uniref:AT-rich interactive domain-containing protein 5B n=1 Tax=Mizuhopecten yessoensis TaxID=6573 RepID=A0A210QPX7_MIZYE|nr:AT-rich interactive domain-containing protein 5B-like isoform X2 [Mizuhopecten yessoensis]OWF50796.1 AT-rich interactive domain-containing protein 5B [Mizuhopecten yessoensis]